MRAALRKTDCLSADFISFGIAVITVGIITFCVSASGTDSDSLEYMRLRNLALTSDTLPHVVDAAQGLSAEGLFGDAVELFHELAPGFGANVAKKHHIPLRWKTSFGADYYHLEDVDTIAMTQDEYLEYLRLMETPALGWTRIKAVITPESCSITDMTPVLLLSNQKGGFELSAHTVFLNGLISAEPSIKAEKDFVDGDTAESYFDPAVRHPSDMGGVALRLTARSNPGNGKLFVWTIPVNAKLEHYRAGRPGYESMAGFRIAPGFEFSRPEKPVSLRMGIEAGYSDYYRTEPDTLNVFLGGVQFESSLRAKWWNAHAGFYVTSDRYPDRFELRSVDRTDVSLKAENRSFGYTRPCLAMRYLYERESYSAPGPKRQKVDGHELKASPGVKIVPAGFLSFKPALTAELRTAKSREGYIERILWEPRRALEPGVSALLDLSFLMFETSVSYRSEYVDSVSGFTGADNRSLKAGLSANMRAFKIVTIDFSADYQYRKYEPFGRDCRMSENISISGNITADF